MASVARKTALSGALLSVLVAICAAWLLVSLYRDGKALGMDERLHARYWAYAVPAAVSQLDYGLQGYRGYVSVLMHFVDGGAQRASPRGREELIRSASAIPDVAAKGIYLFPGDEKGLQDFVVLAFTLFGQAASSFYLLYFGLMAVSVTAHLLCFAGRPARQAAVLPVLAALLAILPALRVTSELDSLLNPRAFGLLSLPALISLGCFALNDRSSRLWQMPLLLIQTALLAFVVHVRNAEAWQLAGLVLVASLAGVRAYRRSRREKRPEPVNPPWRHPAATALALVFLAAVGLKTLVETRFAPEYSSSKLVGKIFWHNVGIGFSVSDRFRGKYGLELSDTSFLLYVARSAEVAQSGEAGKRVFWSGTYTGQWVGGDPEIRSASDMNHAGMVRDFVGYEKFARRVVFRLMRDHPLWTLRLFLVDKPRLLYRQAVNAFVPGVYTVDELMLRDQAAGIADETVRRRDGLALRLLSFPLAAVLALCLVSFPASTGRFDLELVALAAGLTLLAVSPLMLTYPLVHLMASFLAMAALTGAAGIVALGTRMVSRVRLVSEPTSDSTRTS